MQFNLMNLMCGKFWRSFTKIAQLYISTAFSWTFNTLLIPLAWQDKTIFIPHIIFSSKYLPPPVSPVWRCRRSVSCSRHNSWRWCSHCPWPRPLAGGLRGCGHKQSHWHIWNGGVNISLSVSWSTYHMIISCWWNGKLISMSPKV